MSVNIDIFRTTYTLNRSKYLNEKIIRWLTFYVLLYNNGGEGMGNRSVLFEVPKKRLRVVEAGKSSSERAKILLGSFSSLTY